MCEYKKLPLIGYLCIPFEMTLMGRILAIDYGQKRVGIAATDPTKLIASGLTTVHSNEVFSYLDDYFKSEDVETVVIGAAKQMNNEDSQSSTHIEPFVKNFEKRYPTVAVKRVDERFTSKIAERVILESGIGKKARQNKKLVDTVSATLILQSYLEQMEAENNRTEK